MIQVYPVVFTPTETGYVASVPDLDIDTQGKDLAEAIYMARDAIGLWGISEQDAGRTVPAPSQEEPAHEANELVSWVDIDFDDYRRQYDMTAERTNVTIPRYLKRQATEAGLNLSHELQDRLKERLGV